MEPDSLAYTKPFQLTKTIRRDPYDALSPSKPENSAAGKIILITGGGTGLGAAAAIVWARAGAEGVVLAGRRVEKLEETAEKVRGIDGGKTKALAVGTDLLKDKDVENLFTQTLKTFGRAPDVVLANAGAVEKVPIGEHGVDAWWDIVAINLKGVYATAHHFIKAQEDPKNPKGTFITTNSGLGAIIDPGVSAYSIAKLGAQRLVEFLHVEYPTLRSFTLYPGVIRTDLMESSYAPFAKDHVELTGMLALWLASPQADYLKGSLTSINWDVEEMNAHKERIVKEDLLKIKFMPILPASGGNGL